MIETLIQTLGSISPELATAMLASLPVTELRAAIPVAVFVFKLSSAASYLWAVLGNLVPVALVFGLLPPAMRFALRYTPALNRRLETYFEKLKTKHGEKYSKWGAFFLLLFVSIPFPGTGAWTGSVLAVLFRIKRTLAIPYIVAGVFIAGLLILGITQGAFHGLRLV